MLSMRSRWPFILCVVHVTELSVVFTSVHVVIPWVLPGTSCDYVYPANAETGGNCQTYIFLIISAQVKAI